MQVIRAAIKCWTVSCRLNSSGKCRGGIPYFLFSVAQNEYSLTLTYFTCSIILSLRKICNLQFPFISVGMQCSATTCASCHKISHQKYDVQHECDICYWPYMDAVNGQSFGLKLSFDNHEIQVHLYNIWCDHFSRYSLDNHHVVLSMFLSL